MHIRHRHDWNISPSEAVALQRELRREIVADRPIDLAGLRLVAGVDVSVKENRSQAAVVVLSFPKLWPLETVRSERPTPFP